MLVTPRAGHLGEWSQGELRLKFLYLKLNVFCVLFERVPISSFMHNASCPFFNHIFHLITNSLCITY